MKTTKKLLATTMALLSLGTCVACNPFEGNNGDGTKIDTSKSQLYVSNYNGGYGTEWLNEVQTRFEETYKDVSFEKDKVGVQLVIRSDKDGYRGKELYEGFQGNRNEVFFSEKIAYYDFVNSNYLLDISDVMYDGQDGTAKYNTTDPNADTKTIASKLNDVQLNYLTKDGKVYAVPHYVGINGITYDIDLFDVNKLYFKKNSVASEDYALDKEANGGFQGTVAYTNLAGERSAGPDGYHGTYDDGLPATYDEFFTLCAYMQNLKGIQPFTISGQYSDAYITSLLSALTGDYEGYDQTMLNYTFDGTAKNLITVSQNGITPDATDTEIENSNGYELSRQAGKYYALQFLEGIKNYFDNSSKADEDSHVAAQTRYLRSSYKGESIAFLIEGNWWENEATSTFNAMAKDDDSYSKMNRRFGFLPLPKATNEQIGQGQTLVDNLYGFAFISKNIDAAKIELAKTFLKFCYSDYSLVKYTETTGTLKALNYEMDAASQAKLSEYGRQLWSLYTAETTKVVYQFSQNRLYLANQSNLELKSLFQTNLGTGAFTSIVKNGVKAKAYFEATVSFNSKTNWANKYGSYFEE